MALESKKNNLVLGFVVLAVFWMSGVKSWTGEIHGRVVCDVCADSSMGPEDHVLEGSSVFCSSFLFTIFHCGCLIG